MMDVSIWKLHQDDSVNYWGQSYLYLYKDSFIKSHKELIFTCAHKAKIPVLLLASVAWQEAGGKPDTFHLTDEQLILVGARYNRGIERKKDDFIQAISFGIGDARRDYISYGLAILKRRKHIKKLLGID
jgi:hypothetical protein